MDDNPKILHLSIKKEYFEVMVTGEKTFEFRKPSDWNKSRLFEKHKTYGDELPKKYGYVRFTNGYGNDKPYFTCVFLGFQKAKDNYMKKYSNGETVKIFKGDFIISLGKIVEIGNYNMEGNQ